MDKWFSQQLDVALRILGVARGSRVWGTGAKIDAALAAVGATLSPSRLPSFGHKLDALLAALGLSVPAAYVKSNYNKLMQLGGGEEEVMTAALYEGALSSLRSAGVPITNQLLADQWAYQQRALALFPGQPAKCVLFQDAAGTTPVTAVEQPIGLALDLETAGTWDGVTALTSLPGTHMRQNVNTAKRAMFSARVNLLERSQEFDNAYWTKTNCSVTTNAIAAPDGTVTADKIVENTANSTHILAAATAVSCIAGVTYVRTIRLKAGERHRGLAVEHTSTTVFGSVVNAQFDLINGAIVASTGCVATLTAMPDGWWLLTMTMTAVASGSASGRGIRIYSNTGTSTYLGDGVSGFFVWGDDLRSSVDVHPSIPAYQRVTTPTDYDTVGFPVYKRFDGTDDAYASVSSLNLAGTDEVTVFAPITKESDATAAALLELSADASVNSGSFGLLAPIAASASYGFRTGGNANTIASSVGFAAPRKSLLSGIGKISTDTAIIRVNGAQAASSAADQGTGNYGNYTLFEGARNQTSVYFRGESQGFLILGKNLTASQLAIVERYINQLWKAY